MIEITINTMMDWAAFIRDNEYAIEDEFGSVADALYHLVSEREIRMGGGASPVVIISASEEFHQ